MSSRCRLTTPSPSTAGHHRTGACRVRRTALRVGDLDVAVAVRAELKARSRVVADHIDLCHYRCAARDRQHTASGVAAVRHVLVAVEGDIGEVDILAGVGTVAEPDTLPV
jgi:hypothetical protein